jgi:nucleotide-binding universal stress UspA family protein
VFRKILVAFDGSPGAWRALREGMALAREHDAAIYALAVEEPLPHYASAAEEVKAEESEVTLHFDRLLAEARETAASQGLMLQTEAVRGHAAQAIVQYAKQFGADLVVVGQRGHSGLIGRLLGSTSDRVVDMAPCSVLVVRDERVAH